MPEEWMRNVVSQLGAQEFLIGFLLKNALREQPVEDIPKIAQALKDQIRQMPDSVTGAFPGNDHLAERFSDIVVKMHEQIDKILDEAARAVVEVANMKRQGR